MYTGLEDNRSGIGPVSSTAGRQSSASVDKFHLPSVGRARVQALMDLSLPRFTKLDDGVIPKTKPWPVKEHPPASPTSAEDGNRTRTPSPCMDLDDISTDSSVGDTSPQNFKVTLLYTPEDSDTPVGSIVFSSDEDVPLSFG